MVLDEPDDVFYIELQGSCHVVNLL
jgi:hypothetical protein